MAGLIKIGRPEDKCDQMVGIPSPGVAVHLHRVHLQRVLLRRREHADVEPRFCSRVASQRADVS